MLVRSYEPEIHYEQVIFHDFPTRMPNSKPKNPLYIQLCTATVGLVKHAIQFLSLFLGDVTSCLLLRTVCFSCLLAKTSDTSVDGTAVHQTAERHISARLPQGVTEGSVSADPRWSVSGKQASGKFTESKTQIMKRNSFIPSFTQAWMMVPDH